MMCAYPHLNFAYACENQDLLIRTLRERWGFNGYVESDRRAQQSTVPSILGRVSVELDEEPEWYSPDRIKAALSAGQITEADVNELVRRRFVKMFEFGHFDTPYNRFLPTDYSRWHGKRPKRASSCSRTKGISRPWEGTSDPSR